MVVVVVYLSICLPASLKTKLFCETSLVFYLDNIKNAANLREFFRVWTWQHQKRNNSARLSHLSTSATSKTKQFCEIAFQNGKLSAELAASYQCVLRFFHSMCAKCCACHAKVMPGHTKCCTCHAKIILANLKIWCSKVQPISGNQRPDPLQMSHACHRFWNCCQTVTFCSVQHPLRLPRKTTSERPTVVRTWGVFNILTWTCASRHNGVSQVVREWCVFYILTWKCASRHSGVHFFVSHPPRRLRTRRFSEPTFRPSTTHWKNTVFCDFATFSRACISYVFWLFLFSDLLSPSDSLLWLFPPLFFHLSILSEVWLLNFLRSYMSHTCALVNGWVVYLHPELLENNHCFII